MRHNERSLIHQMDFRSPGTGAEYRLPGGYSFECGNGMLRIWQYKEEEKKEMNIDWSKAPEGATHYAPAHQGFRALWAKFSDGKYHFYNESKDEWYWGAQPLAEEVFIERPNTPAWTGTGLPPVGTVCEVEAFHIGRGEWTQVKVLAHAKHDEDDALLVCEIDHDGDMADMHGVIYRQHYFRPIRTQEQIEAEEREKEIGDLACHLMLHAVEKRVPMSEDGARKLAKYLHLDSYRKQPKEDA